MRASAVGEGGCAPLRIFQTSLSQTAEGAESPLLASLCQPKMGRRKRSRCVMLWLQVSKIPPFPSLSLDKLILVLCKLKSILFFLRNLIIIIINITSRKKRVYTVAVPSIARYSKHSFTRRRRHPEHSPLKLSKYRLFGIDSSSALSQFSPAKAKPHS